MATTFAFTVHCGDQQHAVTEQDLAAYAERIGLSQAAPGRYSWLLVLQTLLHEIMHGIDPYMVVDEIRALEGHKRSTQTKAASEFTREPLKGLWHKHFFSARFVVHNIGNQLAGDKLRMLVEEVFNPEKSEIVTAEMINELSHRATVEAFEVRAEQGKLTGEWIIFAKHAGQNYYLTVSTHNTGDELIYEQIRSICHAQFPFLKGDT